MTERKNAFFLQNAWVIESSYCIKDQPDWSAYALSSNAPASISPQTTQTNIIYSIFTWRMFHNERSLLKVFFILVSTVSILRIKSLLGRSVHALNHFELQHFDYLPFFSSHSMFVYCARLSSSSFCTCLHSIFAGRDRTLWLLQSSVYFLHLKMSVEIFLDCKTRCMFFFHFKWNMCKVFSGIAASVFHFCVAHMFQWPNMMLIADTSNNLE